VAYKHVNEVVPAPSRLVPGLPPALDALVAMATSRDPDLRPADAGQFLHAVTDVRQGLPQPSPGYPAAPGTDWPADPGRYPVPQRSPVPPPILDYQPASWPAEPGPPQHADELIPGMAEPGRQAFGLAGRDEAASAHTQQVQDDAFYRGANHTLIVAPETAANYGGRGSYRGPREPGLQRWLFSRKLGYVIAGLAAVILIGLFVWWQSAGRYTTVPPVAGLAADTARIEVGNGGLTAKFSKPQFSNRVAKGSVIGTQPAIGSRVSKGATVTLIVSAGPHIVSVPQVTGGTLANAEAGLRQAGLAPGAVSDQPSATIPSGIVISTTPAAGVSWPQSRPVNLVVSTGQPVPNFVGQQKAVAEQWAQANNVSLNEVADAKTTQPTGTVTQQSVPAGSAFTPHQVITITISNGPQMVNVPDVTGHSVTDAEQALTQAGFQVKVVMIGPLDKVFNESPSGQAPQGSVITLYVGL
jgi:serine/threonine-protein kinase